MSGEDVHRGKDGWLFLTGGTNRVLDFYTVPQTFSDALADEWVSLLRDRRQRCEALGAVYLHLSVPEKLSVYYDKFLGDLPFRSETPANKIPRAAVMAGVGDLVVNLLPALLEQRSTAKLYWQTDTHWTFEGCLCAFRLLCNRLEVDVSPTIVSVQPQWGSLLLDLGSKVTPPLREDFTAVSFLKSARRVAANSLVVFKEGSGRENDGGLHVGSSVVFCNFAESAVPKTVVIFGDSFSEYRPHLLTGMFAETFCEVHFVWSSRIDWGYVERCRPDIVITEAAERFACQVPSDDFDLLRYVLTRMKTLVDI